MSPVTPEIKIVANVDVLYRKAADTIIEQINSRLKVQEASTIALSGGSTPKGLYSLLASDALLSKKMPWDKIHFFWGDERHVPPSHPESNYRMAYTAMLSKAPVPPAHIHRMQTEQPDAEKVADGYEQELRGVFGLRTGELPRFDCILLGMGADGHTASLFPASSALEERERLVAANWVTQFKQYRITMTVPSLINADLVIFMVSGKEKADTLKAVLELDEQTARFPSQLIKPNHGRLLWLVDTLAASKLSCNRG